MFEQAEFRWKGNTGTVHLVVYGISVDARYLELNAEQAKSIGYEIMSKYHYKAWVTDENGDVIYATGNRSPKINSLLDYEVTMDNVQQLIDESQSLRKRIKEVEREFKHQKLLARRRELRRLKKQQKQNKGE